MANVADRDERQELAARLALAHAPGIGAARLRGLLGAFETARSVLAAPAGALAAVPGVGQAGAAAIRAARPEAGEHIITRLEQLGASAVLPDDSRFPPLLREIPEPPAVLFVWGDDTLLSRPAVAIVGSRDHTAYGEAAARLLAAGVARRGAVVVSGMARGVDAVAHQAALDAGGASVGVLGNGFGVVYPAANRGLYERMRERGCLVTELPPGERPRVHTFPRRNRIVSGLALATVVVEARPGSGAIITADNALEQGRTVLAVPGPITSVTSLACNLLIQQGARPALGPGDILEELGIPVSSEERGARNAELARSVLHAPHSELRAQQAPPSDVTGLQRTLWDSLVPGPRHVDALARATGAAAGDVLTALTELELRGLAVQRAGMMFELR